MTTPLIIRSHAFGPADFVGTLYEADGSVIYSHVSSSLDWLRRDLTESFGRKAALAERFPEGFILTWENESGDG